MTETDPYVFQADDAQLIHNIIIKEWACSDLPLSKINVYYAEDGVDPAQFDFKGREAMIRIYADQINQTPRGISYDSNYLIRYIAVIVECQLRSDMVLICDELRRIFNMNRMQPGNDWDQLYMQSYTPLYPSFNFHHSTITLALRCFCRWVPPAKNTYPV